MKIETITITLGAAVYTLTYLYLLGLRIIRHQLDDKTNAVLLSATVGWAVLTATVTLEAVVLIGVARPTSGSLFYVASVLGVVLAGMAALGILSIPKPIAIALAHKRAAILGSVVGNFALLLINLASFSDFVPTVL